MMETRVIEELRKRAEICRQNVKRNLDQSRDLEIRAQSFDEAADLVLGNVMHVGKDDRNKDICQAQAPRNY